MNTTTEATKVCTKCGHEKAVDQFHIDRAQPDGRKYACRLCTNKVKARWRGRNRQRVLVQKKASYDRHRERYIAYYASDRRKKNWFAWKLMRNFGITVDQFADLLEAQAGRCAICGRLPEEANGHKHKHRLHVDHDHKTGKVRGLLCNLCNVGLGSFKDDVDLMLDAVSYLERSQETQEEYHAKG
jgi:hypothetical protein